MYSPVLHFTDGVGKIRESFDDAIKQATLRPEIPEMVPLSEASRHGVSVYDEVAILTLSIHIRTCDIYMRTLHTRLLLICQGDNVEMGN